MILAVLAGLDAASTTPADLVDRIFEARGVAAVAVSSEPTPFVLDGRRRDEVETANLARRWGIVTETRTASGRALRLEMNAFFPETRPDDEEIAPPPKQALRERGGAVARAGELLGRVQPPVGLDALYADRRVRVRIGAGGIEAAIPAVARAVGGRWEPKTRRIAFDPRTFRQALLASVGDFRTGTGGFYDRRETMRRALAICSDADLARAHASETEWHFEVPFPLTEEFARWLIVTAADGDRRNGSLIEPSVRRALAAGWTPAALIEPRRALSLILRDPESDTMLVY